jgi:hypothetical protein
MSRFKQGDIVKVKGFPGHSVIESYLEPDNGQQIVTFWYGKTLVQFVGRDLDKVEGQAEMKSKDQDDMALPNPEMVKCEECWKTFVFYLFCSDCQVCLMCCNCDDDDEENEDDDDNA